MSIYIIFCVKIQIAIGAICVISFCHVNLSYEYIDPFFVLKLLTQVVQYVEWDGDSQWACDVCFRRGNELYLLVRKSSVMKVIPLYK